MEREERDGVNKRRRTGGVGADRVVKVSPLWCEEPFLQVAVFLGIVQ